MAMASLVEQLCTILSDRRDVASFGVKHVGVIRFVFHVVQLLSRRFTS